jgi:hypothetical protein
LSAPRPWDKIQSGIQNGPHSIPDKLIIDVGAVEVYVEPASGWQNITQAVTPTAELTQKDDGYWEQGGELGADVDISGDGLTIVAGAQYWGGSDTGIAFVWRAANPDWSGSSSTTLKLSAPEAGDYFGGSVSVDFDGDTVAVGAPRGKDPGGEGYLTNEGLVVFDEPGTGWPAGSALTQTNLLRSGFESAGAEFGSSVTLDRAGRLLVAGVPNSGPAEVFTR